MSLGRLDGTAESCRHGQMGKQDSAQRRWDRRAPRYDGAGVRAERWAIGDGREWIAAAAAGRTLEVAVGTGRNLTAYPTGVDLVGVDLSSGMLSIARRRSDELGRPIKLCQAAAERLPFPDASFDSVACTLAVCSVADRRTAIAEMIRVLRPGGRLLLLDHAERRWLRGRPADLAVQLGLRAQRRERTRLGLIERFEGRKPTAATSVAQQETPVSDRHFGQTIADYASGGAIPNTKGAMTDRLGTHD
jgi:ubiquinone/menaquinone biosynthesis C-methylase UbiE